MATFYSDRAGDSLGGGVQSVVVQDGGLCAEIATITTTDALAGTDLIHMHRIYKNDRVFGGTAVIPDVEDAATNVTAALGVYYDDTSLTDDDNALLLATGVASAKVIPWPAPASESVSGASAADFIAAGDGYISYTIADGGTGGATKSGTWKSTILVARGADR